MQHGKKCEGQMNFLCGTGARGKGHATCLIQRDIMYIFDINVTPADDQLLVPLTLAHIGSAAFHFGGQQFTLHFIAL